VIQVFGISYIEVIKMHYIISVGVSAFGASSNIFLGFGSTTNFGQSNPKFGPTFGSPIFGQTSFGGK
jgi:hypothetical protein